MPAPIDRKEIFAGEALGRIKGKIRISWCSILAERLASAFWQPFTFAMFLGAASSFGIFAALPGSYRAAAAAVSFAGLGLLVVLGFSKFRWPNRIDAIRRLDASAPGYPITAVGDVPAIGLRDPGTAAVWREHKARMAEELKTVSPALPKFGISAVDKFALRYIAFTALVVGLAFGPVIGGRENSAHVGGADAAQAGFLIEAWIQPPAYTGKPAVYLSGMNSPDAISVPERSLAILRLYGDPEKFSIVHSVSDFEPSMRNSGLAHEITIRRHGEIRVEVEGDAAVGERWNFNVISDSPPSIELAGEMIYDAGGKLTVPLRMTDDYGVESASAEIEIDLEGVSRRFGLKEEPTGPASELLDIPLPFFGQRSEFELDFKEHFASHRFSGLAVNASIYARDNAGQKSDSLELSFKLPARYFSNPLAASLVELRRELLWSGRNSRRVAQVSRALSHRPEGFIENSRVYFLIRHAVHALESGLENKAILKNKTLEAAETLWAAALIHEDGDLSMAKELLRELAERLEAAIRKGAPENEIAELWDQYLESMNNFLQELAKRGEENPDEFSEFRDSVQEAQLDDMLKRLESFIESGRMSEAAELLSSLQDMLDSVETARSQSDGQTGEFQRAVDELQETLERQQDLTDESFRMLRKGQMERGAVADPSEELGRRFGSEGNVFSQGGQELGDLAGRQTDLQNRLGDQIGSIPLPAESDQFDAAREAFGNAEQSMGRASDYIVKGDLEGAVDEQMEAMGEIREGIRGFSRSWQQASGSEAGPIPSESGMDPFGRRHSNAGLWTNEGMLLQGGRSWTRTEELREEIRRRSGDTSRSPVELDYLRRLLQRF